MLLALLLVLGWCRCSGRPSMCRPGAAEHWSRARWDSAGPAARPGRHTGSARPGLRGPHLWLEGRRLGPQLDRLQASQGAAAYERYDVVAWGVWPGADRRCGKDMRPPDGFWAGNGPQSSSICAAPAAAAAIPRIEAAIAAYPYTDSYVTWPGPNSNSFVAYLSATVPELNRQMPPNAVGKDFLPMAQLAAWRRAAPASSVSLVGLLGLTLASSEGLEVNLLGLVLGIDPMRSGGQAAGPRPGSACVDATMGSLGPIAGQG